MSLTAAPSFSSLCLLLVLHPFIVSINQVSSYHAPVEAPHLQLEQSIPDLNLPFKLPASRQTVDGDGYGGRGYTVLPVLRDEQPATVILLHGLGGTGEEWGYVGLALSFFSLNYVKFIIPTAPTRSVSYRNTSAPSWYDVFFIRDFNTGVNRTQLLSSVARMNRIIRGEVDSGVQPLRIFIVGFSQGGGLALTTFLRSPLNLAGCIGVATWLPLASEYPQNMSVTASNKQILMLHGTRDDAVPISLAVRSFNAINRFGRNINLTVNLTRLQGEGHLLMTPAVMDSIEEYVLARAPGTSRFLINLVNDLTQTFDGLNERMSQSKFLDLSRT